MSLVCLLFPQVSANGSVLRSEIEGSIKLKVVLSGMPELRLGLNDKVLFEITGSELDIRRLQGGPMPMSPPALSLTWLYAVGL